MHCRSAAVVQVPNLLVPAVVCGLCQTTKRYVVLLSEPNVYCKIYLWNTALSVHAHITLHRHAGIDNKFRNYLSTFYRQEIPVQKALTFNNYSLSGPHLCIFLVHQFFSDRYNLKFVNTNCRNFKKKQAKCNTKMRLSTSCQSEHYSFLRILTTDL